MKLIFKGIDNNGIDFEFEKFVSSNDIQDNIFDIDFESDLRVQFELLDNGNFKCINAVDGYGNNRMDDYFGKEAIVNVK